MAEAGAVTQTSLLAVTDAGMQALWCPSRFGGITDYPSWESELLEDDDITRHVQAGDLVPVNIGIDGAFQFVIRVGSAGRAPTLTSRETQYLVASSQPYLYLSDGTARLTGIEHVGADPGRNAPTLAVPVGPHAVTIHLIAWDDEPGASDASGKPAPGALPDFVVLVGQPGTAENLYRTRLQTFDLG